jgi:hypothetical protein
MRIVADTSVDSTAAELDAWFASLAELSAKAFGWHRESHGAAASLHVLRRQAERLRSSRLAEDGASYTALCLFLAAACRTLGLRLETRHWLAALRNVCEQRRLELKNELGIAFGSPSERFKTLFDDAIDAAGLGVQATVLAPKNQKVALGLAVNWGMRTLLAYAAETGPRQARGPRSRHDLTWLATLV